MKGAIFKKQRKSAIQAQFFIENHTPEAHAERMEPHHASWSASAALC